MSESISSELLDKLEEYLTRRVDVDADGHPNRAMVLLQQLQDARELHDLSSGQANT